MGHDRTRAPREGEGLSLACDAKPCVTYSSSLWNAAREMDGAVVRPELVVEVTFDHTSNDRIRHGAKIARWREDKAPADCGMDQLQS